MRAVMVTAVAINSHGGITVSESVVIDGHEDNLPRVVTHAHSDHTKYLSRSSRNSPMIIGTPITLEWLKILGFKLSDSVLQPINYGEVLRLPSGTLRLEKALHIPGTAQVVFDSDEGWRAVYTSDFKKPGSHTPVISSDVLIIDAVYGNPEFRRDFDDYIEIVLVDLVKELLASGSVYIHGYHGKNQEVMMLLRSEGIDAPFILDHKQYALTRAMEHHGLRVRDYHHVGTEEADEIMRDGWFVYFTHFFRRVECDGFGTHVKLSGWEFKKPMRQLGRRWWLVAFSDHSDFQGLVDYVRLSRPKEVIVNCKRSTDGYLFAKYVEKKLGVKTYLLP
ncbi:MAG: hypothetical protein J7L55_05255 [Desulfurococcales archaeon]|nr:hypothetical protein [Desulfurococcales archaeon]